MGSYSEISLSFDFAESTPDYVLAAFSALAAPDQPDGAPVLPTPVVEAWDEWEPDWRLNLLTPESERDPYEHEPWRHEWATRVNLAMGPGTTEHGLLVWSGWRWNLDCRFSWKTDPWSASETLAWLAPYVDPGYLQRKALVGYTLARGCATAPSVLGQWWPLGAGGPQSRRRVDARMVAHRRACTG